MVQLWYSRATLTAEYLLNYLVCLVGLVRNIDR